VSAAQESTDAIERAKQELRYAATRHQFDVLQSEELPQLAVMALEAGLDTPSLRLLAGEMHPTWSDSGNLFGGLLRELDITPLPSHLAALELGRYYATQILAGTLTPAEGAEHIWWDVANEFMHDGRVWPALRGFVGLASEYRDHPEAHAELEQEIRNEARELLKTHI
jgi:hypothetical protein